MGYSSQAMGKAGTWCCIPRAGTPGISTNRGRRLQGRRHQRAREHRQLVSPKLALLGVGWTLEAQDELCKGKTQSVRRCHPIVLTGSPLPTSNQCQPLRVSLGCLVFTSHAASIHLPARDIPPQANQHAGAVVLPQPGCDQCWCLCCAASDPAAAATWGQAPAWGEGAAGGY